MLDKIKGSIKKNLEGIKPNDIVIVSEEDGRQTSGRIKIYTEDQIVVEVTNYVEFDARTVKMEKINQV